MKSKFKRILNIFGPGLISGAADDDPSGIATYTQTGAQFGFQLTWMALFTLPFLVLVQEMCARLGMVTEKGLAENIRTHYQTAFVYVIVFILFAANTFNIAADINVMAKCTQLIIPYFNFIFLVISFSVICVILQTFIGYRQYAKYLKYLCLTLFCYVIVAFFIAVPWITVWKYLLIPHIAFDKDQIILICAILGTTISPYLFFWQTSQEIEEKKKTTKKQKTTKDEVNKMRLDIGFGMFVSNLIMFFIIVVCSTVFYIKGITQIESAEMAASAFKPLVGQWATILFSLGIIGTGLLAIPVLAGSSAYAVAEVFHWNEGLYKKLHQAFGFYCVIALSLLIAVLINFIHLNPIKILIYSAMANGIIAPVMLFFIMKLTNDKKIMGQKCNVLFTNIFGWILTILMVISSIVTIIFLILSP